MKTPPFSKSRKPHAVALIITLSILSLLVLLIVSMTSMATTEHRSSRDFTTSTHLQSLSETPLNLVIAQIRAATSNLKNEETWASQPGMIRRYPSTGTHPKPSGIYKLYSSNLSTLTGNHPDLQNFDPEKELPPVDWDTQKAHFTDLNAPLMADFDHDGLQDLRFPILDPRILGKVEGFDYDDQKINGVVKGGAEDQQRLPMPVRWIYTLADGTLGVLDTNGRFVGSKVPTAQNPINGRMAYWTDDETSKVNLNTASEGVYWSHPYGLTITERSKSDGNQDWVTGMPLPPYGYATSMPLGNEFQRLPGHPAGTSLSPILKHRLPLEPNPAQGENAVSFQNRFAEQLLQYYQLVPRIQDGGSRGGTVWTGKGDHVQRIGLDSDRLFVSTDELLLKPNRSRADTRIDPQVVEQSQFFLTTQSRAPEVTLQNKPRVSLWPIMREQSLRNTLDHLIAFCSTMDQKPYYWQRWSQWKTPSNPGSAQILNQEWDQIARNREIYRMLEKQLESPIPGFGNRTFAQKYGNADQVQILTSAVDYIRSSLATVPNGLPPHYWYSAARNGNGAEVAVTAAQPGEGSVVPLQISRKGTTSRGYGRFITVTEGSLLLHPARDPANPSQLPPAGKATHVSAVFLLEPFSPSLGLPSWGPNVRYVIKGLDRFQINGQNLGFPSTMNIVGEVPVGYFDGLGHDNVAYIGFYQLFRTYTGDSNSSSNAGRTLGNNERTNYTLYGRNTIPIPANSGTLSFTGGEITIEIHSAHQAAPGDLLQTIRMNFPNSNAWPIPQVIEHKSHGDDKSDATYTNFNERITHGAGNMEAYMQRVIRRGDVVRSVEARPDLPLGGDLRILSALADVPSELFAPHPNYHSSDFENGRFAHSLRNDRHTHQGQIGWRNRIDVNDAPGVGQDFLVNSGYENWQWRTSSWSTGGAIISNRIHFRDHSPAVARGLNGALRIDGRYGDWETGTGISPDGCYIRKPSEGSVTSGKGDGGYFMHLQGSEGGDWGANARSEGNFYPNRQIASPVQFGALNTGVFSRRPFETLLFCPNPAGRTTNAESEPSASDHKGFEYPRDHVFLDLFWMPAVEPYALSEPLSTAGKINLNYEIMPYRYIKRRTGIHAVLDKTRVTAIPTVAIQGFNGSHSYKQSSPCQGEFRYDINLDPVNGTLRGFEKRFQQGDIFRSASEICDIFMIPKRRTLVPENYSVWYNLVDPVYSNVVNWWSQFQLTGDNLRENPYDHVYPRLTTKSNSYRVHYKVQSLKKARSTSPEIWDENLDQILGESMGSVLLERFVDLNPQNKALPDFATQEDASMDDLYQFRVISRRRL